MYTFVAYKPNSVEYSMGCRMGGYDSDFVSLTHLNRDELILEWSNILCANSKLEYSEEGYKVQIWEDGDSIWDEMACWYDIKGGMSDEDYEIKINQIVQLSDEAVKLHFHTVAAKKAAEDKKAAQILADQESRDKEQRRREFEKLKKEFMQ